MNHKEKAEQFHRLHHSGKLLILPNIWDSLGAHLLEDLGYPAIATASAAIAYSNGYADGENISFNSLIAILTRIAESVNVPVTADFESGFAENNLQLENNVRQLIQTGIVGINFEDTNRKTNSLFPVEVQCERIRVIKKVAEEMSESLFINARTDVFIRGNESPESKLKEALKRGAAYKDAGADCFFPITLQNADAIKQIIETLQMPVNILLVPGVPELNELQKIGVARASLGPGFLKIAIRAMKTLAEKLLKQESASDVTGNEITSAYLADLVSRKVE